MNSCCEFGTVYRTLNGIEAKGPEAYEYLIGSKEKLFKVKEIELFQVYFF
jgi:hypothetical protein